MPRYSAEISVVKRMKVAVEAADMQDARQKLSNLEFDPEAATEVVGWNISPSLKLIDESRPYGEPVSALDLYNRQMRAKLI